MTATELNRIVASELERIPHGAKGSMQNEVRMLYNMVRRRNLGRGTAESSGDTLRHCVAAVLSEVQP